MSGINGYAFFFNDNDGVCEHCLFLEFDMIFCTV